MRGLKLGCLHLFESPAPETGLTVALESAPNPRRQPLDWREVREVRDFCDEWLRERGRA